MSLYSPAAPYWDRFDEHGLRRPHVFPDSVAPALVHDGKSLEDILTEEMARANDAADAGMITPPAVADYFKAMRGLEHVAPFISVAAHDVLRRTIMVRSYGNANTTSLSF